MLNAAVAPAEMAAMRVLAIVIPTPDSLGISMEADR